MKKNLIISWIVLMLLTIVATADAQQSTLVKRKYFSMDPRIKRSDYYQGMIQVKLKPEFKTFFPTSTHVADKRFNLLKAMQISGIESAVPKGMLNNAKARSSKPFNFDPGLYQMIYFNNAYPVEDAINLLYNSGMVEIAEPVYTVRNYSIPNDSLVNLQFYLSIIKAFQAWDVSKGDSTVVIGIPDTGVDIDHADLTGNLFINTNDPVDGVDNDNNGYVDDWRGWDFAGASASNPYDQDNDPSIHKGNDFSHGTGVGGVIGARGNNGIGLSGVSQRCKLLFTKHYADDQPDSSTRYAVAPFTGLLYCAMMGADIINCSWGGPYPSQIYQDYIDMVTEDLGIVIVASAGNSGVEEESYPASYRNVISVGALEKNYKKSDYSTYNTNVDLMAPGSNIPVISYHNAYTSNSGTSFSAPMVSGAAALVKSVYPDFNGLQIGELLRVTANDTIYTVNPSTALKHKLGTGVLDIESALTKHPPGIRIKSYSLLNAEGNLPKPGEDAFLTAGFINYLWPSTSGLTVTLKSQSSLMTVSGNTGELGIVGTMQSTSNASQPFKVTLQDNIPENSMINLLFEFSDGTYYDYQFISILLNPTFINITENNIASSMAGNGRIGYQDNNQQQGLGVVLDGNEMLFEMGLMLGTSSSKISDCVRTGNSQYDNDFAPVQSINEVSPGFASESEIYGSFNDDSAKSSKSNVLVSYRTMVWKGDPDNNYFIVRYSVKNQGSDTLKNFYAGLYADWDISDLGANDRADWDSLHHMGYVYSLDTAKPLYGAIQVLTGQPDYWAIENDNSLPGNPFGVYDSFTDQEKFLSLSSGIGNPTAGSEFDSGTDVSHTVASGPYIINPDDSISIAFAVHAAKNLPDLIASAAAADTMYNYTLNAPAPLATNDTICWNANAQLTASNASSLNWYKTKTGGTPFYSGDSLVIDHVLNDTVFYVANADSVWESIRTPIQIIVKANPEITVSGSTVLCKGDTVTLMAGIADSYLWNPGEQTTQLIQVSDSGLYRVTVFDQSLNCTSQSPWIRVIKNTSPVASFSSDIQQITENLPTIVSLTDKSTNAVSWQWQLSDGQSSTMEDPIFTLTSAVNLSITLTVTASNGCQDNNNQVITVAGLNNSQEENGFLVYPNPVLHELILETLDQNIGQINILIYDRQGKMVYNKTLSGNLYKSLIQLDIGNIFPGLYILTINGSGRQIFISKFIKK